MLLTNMGNFNCAGFSSYKSLRINWKWRKWLLYIWIFLLIFCSGYENGKWDTLRRQPKIVPIAIQSGNPNTDPKYKSLRDEGYVWVDGVGWQQLLRSSNNGDMTIYEKTNFTHR